MIIYELQASDYCEGNVPKAAKGDSLGVSTKLFVPFQ